MYSLFTGCSFVAGSGFPIGKAQPELWVNLLHAELLKNTKLLNVAEAGKSNAGIFQNTMKELVDRGSDIKYAFVSFTSYPRFEMSTGLELYETRLSLMPNGVVRDYVLNGITYTKEYLTNVRDRLVSIPNDHYETVKLIEYANIIKRFCNKNGTKVFFINAICSWDNNFFTRLDGVSPDQFTEYTKQLINVSQRDDDEIFKLYDKIHDEYNDAGGVWSEHWLNLYNSLREMRVDVNDDGIHPGVQSNKEYAKMLAASLINSKMFNEG